MDGTPFGHYQLLTLLGEGGMGQVYRAVDTLTNRVVALKVLPQRLAGDPAFRQRFLREAHLAARLSEPHVVPIHRFGEIDGQLYVDMRLIEGRDLQVELSNVGLMNPVRTLAILNQIAAALSAAHAAGLVHRDVKPSNILLTEADFAYLIDFGIARAADHTALTNVGSTVGTLAYMAPERFGPGETDHRSDVYALTCVLYECLTGRVAFPGGRLEQQIAGHLVGEPPKPSEHVHTLARVVDDVVAIGLAKDPNRRYQTTLDLMRAFALATNDVRDQDRTPHQAVDETRADAAWVVPPYQPPALVTAKAPVARRLLVSLAVLMVVLVAGAGVYAILRGGSTDGGAAVVPEAAGPSRPSTPRDTAKVDSIAATLPEAIKASGKLKIGVNVPFAPSEFKDSQGRLVGFDVDLMNAVTSTLGLMPEYDETDFATIIPSVRGGAFDVGMSSFTDTKERESVADFVVYFSAGTLWARRSDGADIDPNNACGSRIAVQSLTFQETDELPAKSKACTDAGKPPIQILSFSGQDDATDALVGGHADAMSADSPVTGYSIKKSAGKLVAVGEISDSAPYGWPVAKGSPLAQSLLQALQHLIETGVYESIATKWGVEKGMIDKPVVNGAVS